jgi:tripartite-type tricarboxylate transporter receptor subunit TctC
MNLSNVVSRLSLSLSLSAMRGAALGALTLFCLPLTAAAQGWTPVKPISILVPYSAGGSLDMTTRLLATRLAERLGVAVVVENATGAGGSVGILKAMAAAGDGYTLLMAGDAPLDTNAPKSAPAYKHDMLRDLAPIALVNTAPMVLVANPAFPAKTVAELIAVAKAKPGTLNYASPGVGTIHHLATEIFKEQAKIFMVHLPYRGGTQIANDVVGNQVELAMLINATAAPYLKAKSIKPLAVTSLKRAPRLPDVPALSETPGFEGFDVVTWAGLYAPAKTPAEVVVRLNREVNEVLKIEAVRTRMLDGGSVPAGGSVQDFIRFIEQDRQRFFKILKTVSIQN